MLIACYIYIHNIGYTHTYIYVYVCNVAHFRGSNFQAIIQITMPKSESASFSTCNFDLYCGTAWQSPIRDASTDQ